MKKEEKVLHFIRWANRGSHKLATSYAIIVDICNLLDWDLHLITQAGRTASNTGQFDREILEALQYNKKTFLVYIREKGG